MKKAHGEAYAAKHGHAVDVQPARVLRPLRDAEMVGSTASPTRNSRRAERRLRMKMPRSLQETCLSEHPCSIKLSS